jgi:3',5'-nucleoside bisphosphate phosphatase
MNSVAEPGKARNDVPDAAAGGPFADLHLHTLFSDGTFTPEELAARGHEAGLAAMALTDHDSIEGCARMAQSCGGFGIEFIIGTELTAEFAEKEVHLLGYFIEPQNEKLLAEIKTFQAVRQTRIQEMVAQLNKMNVPLRAETVFALANCRSPGRPHVARALVQEGLCQSLEEAFERYLKKGRRAWVPKRRISAVDAIALIHHAGGLAVLAHPGLNHCDEIIAPLKEQGIDGIECFHTKHSGKMARHYLDIAGRLNLLVTGGSDCHGFSKGQPLIGGVKLPGVYFQRFKAAHEARASRRPAIGAPT